MTWEVVLIPLLSEYFLQNGQEAASLWRRERWFSNDPGELPGQLPVQMDFASMKVR